LIGLNNGVRGVERQVLDDVGQEDRRELLTEVDRDPDADPRQLAARQRRDREAERARLAERYPAADEQLRREAMSALQRSGLSRQRRRHELS